MIKMTKKAQKKIWDVIEYLKTRNIKNKTTSKSLELEFCLSGAEIRSIVHYGRSVLHLPICSDSNGYFYARNKYQMEHTIRQMRSRIKFINDAVCGMEKATFAPEDDAQQGFGFNVKTKYDGFPDY